MVPPNGVSTTDGTCAARRGAQVDCGFGMLPAGPTVRTVVIRALVPAGTADGRRDQHRDGGLADARPDPGQPHRVPTTTIVASSADLSISKAPVADPPEAGNTQGYVISVNNAGPSVARGVVISDPLPAGATFVDVTRQRGTCDSRAVR